MFSEAEVGKSYGTRPFMAQEIAAYDLVPSFSPSRYACRIFSRSLSLIAGAKVATYSAIRLSRPSAGARWLRADTVWLLFPQPCACIPREPKKTARAAGNLLDGRRLLPRYGAAFSRALADQTRDIFPVTSPSDREAPR